MSIIHVDGMDDDFWDDEGVVKILRLFDMLGIAFGVLIASALQTALKGDFIAGGVLMAVASIIIYARPKIIRWKWLTARL